MRESLDLFGALDATALTPGQWVEFDLADSGESITLTANGVVFGALEAGPLGESGRRSYAFLHEGRPYLLPYNCTCNIGPFTLSIDPNAQTLSLCTQNEGNGYVLFPKNNSGPRSTRFLQNECGKEGRFSGTLAGGTAFAALTAGNVGYSKYQVSNEDTVAVDSTRNRFVIGDGMGGREQGEVASNHGCRVFMEHQGSLHDAMQAAHQSLQALTWYYRCLFSERKTPDTVMVAGEIVGNQLHTMILGDCELCVIRNSEIVYRTQSQGRVRHTEPKEEDINGSTVKYQIRYIGPTTTLNSHRPAAHFDSFQLEPGDIILANSDGGTLPDDVKIAAVSGCTPEGGIGNLYAATAQNNSPEPQYEYDVPMDEYGAPINGGEVTIEFPPNDNTTYFVAHYKG